MKAIRRKARHLAKEQNGFTLIELMIVVAIIGLLAVALVPAVIDAMERGRNGAMEAATRQIQQFLEMYALDNGEYPDESSVTTDLADYATSWPKNPWDSSADVAILVPGGDTPDRGDVLYELSNNGRRYTLTGYGTQLSDGAVVGIITLKNFAP